MLDLDHAGTAIVGIRVGPFFLSSVLSSIEFIKAGKLRVLAVTMSKRAEQLPDVPTTGEFVPGKRPSPGVRCFVPPLGAGVGAPRTGCGAVAARDYWALIPCCLPIDRESVDLSAASLAPARWSFDALQLLTNGNVRATASYSSNIR
jgi:hypothetical protein